MTDLGSPKDSEAKMIWEAAEYHMQQLGRLTVSSCKCMTKTNNPRYHKEECPYRILEEAIAYIRDAAEDHVSDLDRYAPHGSGQDFAWDCSESPTGYCEYDDETDPARDSCIHCGDPEERK
jgi:hypothetical protein